MARPIECDECGKKHYLTYANPTIIHVELSPEHHRMDMRNEYDFCNIRCLANWSQNMAYD